ncbi:PmbA/TldA family metallopeptidase [Syntrophomonas palmitatica]|uniref:PmbA/TldA family metallopeptidase n=1 Tax=Syntrophomonas palmitatica TaxID=402877 RepID=UPI0006D19228|nr:DNA gyrase modulator [Syntrophomonas palmitatica]
MGTIEEVLRTAGEKVLEAARRKGVEAEAYLLHDQVLNLEVANDQIETLKEAEETGLGLRVLRDGRLGFAYTSDLSDQA